MFEGKNIAIYCGKSAEIAIHSGNLKKKNITVCRRKHKISRFRTTATLNSIFLPGTSQQQQIHPEKRAAGSQHKPIWRNLLDCLRNLVPKRKQFSLQLCWGLFRQFVRRSRSLQGKCSLQWYHSGEYLPWMLQSLIFNSLMYECSDPASR
jgi:hypothetical protein